MRRASARGSPARSRENIRNRGPSRTEARNLSRLRCLAGCHRAGTGVVAELYRTDRDSQIAGLAGASSWGSGPACVLPPAAGVGELRRRRREVTARRTPACGHNRRDARMRAAKFVSCGFQGRNTCVANRTSRVFVDCGRLVVSLDTFLGDRILILFAD